MRGKKDAIDIYYRHIEDKYCCKISDELLGKKYIIGKQFGVGNFSRMRIEDGLEISKANIAYKMEMEFDNREFDDDILELGYCYNGDIEIFSMPDNKKYILEAGNMFIYKSLNDVEHFNLKYNKCKTISIQMNFNTIKDTINPIWEDRAIIDWQKNMNNIFKENILIIEKASYDIKKIAEQIDSISTHNVVDYMNFKLKTIEFLTTVLKEKYNERSLRTHKEQESEIIIMAKDIISKNLQNSPSVKELASRLNISVYKLQEGFKNDTGYTVYEYIQKSKMEKAKYLLKNTELSIIEIANEIGYENPSKFANLFKRYNNITPLKYRKL
ncbi:AraC family transcriptional regulator [Clostridium sp. MSJ-11]|uniref:AraC family transcriptional regulator n=1 Tax=Clostridium mobile TaxID=2841512 RepID=A0ABS6EJ33_9CLOT|nr:AraC family transcriptional regulator [Clostridium mobile]MBU5485211.1 AraC family transcriptional regulator [Clostridium mobile]